MVSIKHAVMGCAALALATLFAYFSASPEPVMAAQCNAPGFAIPQASPFRVDPATGVAGQPRGLARGTFFRRSGSNTACDCDLAVTVAVGDSAQPDSLVLLRGNEDGTFVKEPGVSVIEVEENPSLIAAGKFNGATALDSVVVVSNRATGRGEATIFNANAQTGRYERAASGRTSWSTGAQPGALAIGDVNGDQRLDAVIGNQGDRSLSVLLGTGTGSFGDPIVVSGLRGTPDSIAVGKFSNSGGAQDIAVALTSDGLPASPSAAVAIVRGSSANPPAFAVDAAIEVGPRGSGRPLVAAANLSSPPSGTSPGTFRDLVVAFTDAESRASTVLLVGRSSGGFDLRAGPSLGATLPRSLVVADFDDDRAADLAVSFGTSADSGEIRFFQGKTAPAQELGFHPNPAWRSVQTSARAGSLVTGRFGAPRSAGSAPPHLGVAAITLRPADMVSVHLGSGQGAFVEPTLVTTRLAADPQLMVGGDFHSLNGDSPLRDLAYVSTGASGLRLLSVLLSNGAGGFSPPAGTPAVRAGANPSLMTAGQFAGPAAGFPIDLAVVDRQTSGNPILRIFIGNGVGRFTPSQFEVRLAREAASAMVAAPFRAGMVMDVAVSGGGMLTVYFNDGSGRFSDGPAARADTTIPPGTSSMAVSSRLRQQGTPDLVIRGGQGQITFLVNIGQGQFRPGLDQNGIFTGAGNVDAILVGDVTGDGFDDAITFDEDMTLRVFVNRANEGGEGFGAPVVSRPLQNRAVRFAGPGYVLADFADGQLGLAATVIANAAPSGTREVIAVLKSDAKGAFVADDSSPALTVPAFAGTDAKVTFRTEFQMEPSSGSPERVEGHRIAANLPGVFRGAGLGNGKADLAVVSKVTTVAFGPNACVSDPRTAPAQERVCRVILTRNDPDRGLLAGMADPDTPCCNCTTGPQAGRCPGACDLPPLPRVPVCRTTREYTLLTVYGNTCDVR